MRITVIKTGKAGGEAGNATGQHLQTGGRTGETMSVSGGTIQTVERVRVQGGISGVGGVGSAETVSGTMMCKLIVPGISRGSTVNKLCQFTVCCLKIVAFNFRFYVHIFPTHDLL